PAAQVIDLASLQGQPFRDPGRAICSVNGGRRWWHFNDPSGTDPNHVYYVELVPKDLQLSDGSSRAASLDGLDLELFKDTACTDHIASSACRGSCRLSGA